MYLNIFMCLVITESKETIEQKEGGGDRRSFSVTHHLLSRGN